MRIDQLGQVEMNRLYHCSIPTWVKKWRDYVKRDLRNTVTVTTKFLSME